MTATRAIVGSALLITVLVGSVVIGAINTITKEHWPDW